MIEQFSNRGPEAQTFKQNMPLTRNARLLGWTLTVVINGVLLWYFHDRFWWPQDDGVFAHIAQRVANGEIIHRDVEEFRSGYAVFINAWALQVFGENFLSLRYPLVFAAFVQSLMVFSFFVKYDLILAVVLGISSTALGVVHFLNPNHQWYCLALMFFLVYVLERMPARDPWRYFLAGFLAVTIFNFRQLTGVLVMLGLVSCFVLEQHDRSIKKRSSLARGFVFVMFLAMTMYLAKATDWTGLVLFGQWPLWVLLWMMIRLQVTDEDFLKILKGLSIGALAAFLPLLIYHAAHGSLSHWVGDVFLRAPTVLQQGFLKLPGYSFIIDSVKLMIAAPQTVSDVINGVYWLVILLLAPLNGILFLCCLMNKNKTHEKDVYALAVLAVFYGVVSLHNQIPIYIYFTLGLTLAGLFRMMIALNVAAVTRRLGAVILLFLCCTGIYYHAAQSVNQDFLAILRGNKLPLVYSGGIIDKLDLWIDARDRDVYKNVIDVIDRKTLRTETIFAVPNNAEIYFLSGRKNAVRFYSTDQGLQNGSDLRQVHEIFEKRPPALVTYVPDDKRNTVLSRNIMDDVKKRYVRYNNVAEFEIYLRPDVARRNLDH